MREPVHSELAPRAIGPYSQAIVGGGLVWCSGQTPLDPVTGELVEGPVEDQARRVLLNLGEVLRSAGTGLDRALKVTVYLTSMADFAAMNSVYAEFFGAAPPARTTVEVSALPRGARIEMDVVAARPGGNRSAHGLLHAAAAQAPGAQAHPTIAMPGHAHANALQVGKESPRRHVVSVGDPVPEDRLLAADLALTSHRRTFDLNESGTLVNDPGGVKGEPPCVEVTHSCHL